MPPRVPYEDALPGHGLKAAGPVSHELTTSENRNTIDHFSCSVDLPVVIPLLRQKADQNKDSPCLPVVTPDLLCCPGIHDHTASIHPAIGPTPPGSSQLSFPPASGSSCKSRVGVGVQKKRGVHVPHTPFFPLPDLPFFPLPTSLPLH